MRGHDNCFFLLTHLCDTGPVSAVPTNDFAPQGHEEDQ